MAVATRRVVREIPRIDILQVAASTEKDLLPVAAYARVSTEKDEQEDSFERQVEHYTQLISANKEWRMVEIYKDPGISGTRAEKRPDFMRMIDDCRAGKIKKILVKSISRFARNTVDALQYIREQRDLGISVYFENENIDTLTPGTPFAVGGAATKVAFAVTVAEKPEWEEKEVALCTVKATDAEAVAAVIRGARVDNVGKVRIRSIEPVPTLLDGVECVTFKATVTGPQGVMMLVR